VVMVGDDAAQQVELAEQAMKVADFDAAAAHLSAAIRRFTAAGERRRAALACARLGDLFAHALGNQTAARAWFVRATRLVEAEPPCIEQGWVAVAALGCDVDDPSVLLARAELALDRARRFGDVNLETKALADAGLAHVQAGRVAQGMAMLDEAMALACGPADDAEAAGKSVCSFLTACYYAADFDRAGSWVDALCRHGLIGKALGPPLILSNHCDSVHAAALCELGRWSEAETLLVAAIEELEAGMHMPSWHPAIALAELRIRQGRLADAEMLLLGKDGHLQALLPAARLHLARGDHELARATAARGLRAVGADRLRAVELLAVLVDTELGVGDLDAAAAACEDLVARARGLDVPGLQARVAAVRARVLTAAGDVGAAVETVEAALDTLPSTGVPLLRAVLLIDLVRLHERVGDRPGAEVEARRAAAALAGLDVVVPPADVALLERFGVAAPTAGNRTARHTATLVREDRCWVVACGDTRARVADTKGLRYLAELVRSPGAERHALDLVDRVEGVAAGEPGLDRRHLGDAGEVADSRARTAYRHRIEALRAEIDDALESGAEGRAEALQGELDQLVGQLAQAFGLGGRSRRASSAAERARLNVTRALRAATAKLREALPEAGTVLDQRVRTGLYCCYTPDDGDDVRWVVQSRLNGVDPV
jgi:tetratricopeptide (TPR) repeat protein